MGWIAFEEAQIGWVVRIKIVLMTVFKG